MGTGMDGIGRKPNKVLIAAPTHECKRYALIPYLRAIRNLRHEDGFLLLADNSPTPDFCGEMKALCGSIRRQFEIVHISGLPQGGENEESRIGPSRELIRRFAINGGFDLWFSLETDVICPPDTLEYLLRIREAGFDIVRHAYPARQDMINFIDAMGCAVYPVDIFKEISWKEGDPNYVGGDCAFYQWSLDRGLSVCNIFNGLNLLHLEG